MRIYIHIYPSPDREVTSDSDRVWNHVIGPDFRSRDRIWTSLTKNVFFVFFQSLLFEFQLLFSLFVFSSTVYHHELKCVDKQAYVKSTLIWTEKEDVHHLKVSILSYVIWNENEKEKWHCKQKLLLGIDDLSVWLLLLFTECVPSSCADLNKLYICILYILYKMFNSNILICSAQNAHTHTHWYNYFFLKMNKAISFLRTWHMHFK